jgi:AraC-like DNA-binding protein
MESYPTCRQFAFHHHSALRDYLESRDIRWAGMDYLKRRFRAGTPSSDTHLVWLPFLGALECDHGAGFQPLVAGSAAICPAGHPHWLRLTAPAATGLWLHFNPTPRWSRFDAAPPGIYRDLPLGHVSALVDAYLLPSSGSAAGTVGAKIQALELIVFSIEQALEQVTGGERHGFKAKIEILEARIQKKLTDDWTVARLAAALNMSPSYLHKTMLKHLRLTPMALVTKLRMNQAMSRLIHTDMTLAAIADEVGYANAYAFSNAFKRELGRSPARFRASK